MQQPSNKGEASAPIQIGRRTSSAHNGTEDLDCAVATLNEISDLLEQDDLFDFCDLGTPDSSSAPPKPIAASSISSSPRPNGEEDLPTFFLLKAASRGDLAAVQAQVRDSVAQGSPIINNCDRFGWTALHQAAHVGALGVCLYLLQAGADPTARTKTLDSVLHLLYRPLGDSLDEYAAVVSAIITADPTLVRAENLHRDTPLHALCARLDAATVAVMLDMVPSEVLFLSNEADETPLFSAVHARKKETVALLLQRGSDCAHISRSGTALTLAVRLGYQDVATVLRTALPAIAARYNSALSRDRTSLLFQFGILPSEPLLVSCECALQSSSANVPVSSWLNSFSARSAQVSGRLLITREFLCFNGASSQPPLLLVVPLEEVIAVERTAQSNGGGARQLLSLGASSDDSVVVRTRSVRHCFFGFPGDSRHEVLHNVKEIWTARLRVLGAHESSRLENWSQVTPTSRAASVGALFSSGTSPQASSPSMSAEVRDEHCFLVERSHVAAYWASKGLRESRQASSALEWRQFLREHDLNAEIHCRSERLRLLCRKGIPDAYRGLLWWRLSGAQAKWRTSRVSYADCHLEKERSGAGAFSSRDIEKDITRTLPEHPFFVESAGIETLSRTLVAYAARNPALGYCQGMNFLSGLLLLWMDEEQSFWTLAHLVEDVLENYFGRHMTGSVVDQKLFVRFLHKLQPRLYSHLIQLAFPFSAITTGWFCCLFLNALPKPTALRVWDVLFCEGSKIQVVFLIALAIFHMYEAKILLLDESFKIMQFLRDSVSALYDSETLFRVAFDQIDSRLGLMALDEKTMSSLRFSFWLESENELCVSTKERQFSRLKKASRMKSTELQDLYAQYELAVKDSFTPDGGGIDQDTFREIVLRLQAPWLVVSRSARGTAPCAVTVDQLFHALDTRGDDVLDFEELLTGLATLHRGDAESRLRVFFNCFDLNRDGKLSATELAALVEQFAAFGGASHKTDVADLTFVVWKELLAKEAVDAFMQYFSISERYKSVLFSH